MRGAVLIVSVTINVYTGCFFGGSKTLNCRQGIHKKPSGGSDKGNNDVNCDAQP